MPRPLLNAEQEREKFETFLVEMDDVLIALVEDAAKAGISLDYSMNSLDGLEQFIKTLQRSGSLEDRLDDSAMYFGETVRKNYGGKWELEIDNPKHLYYGLPVIVGHAPSRVKLCPHQTVRMFLQGKSGGFFRQVVASQLRPRELNLKPES